VRERKREMERELEGGRVKKRKEELGKRRKIGIEKDRH